MNFVLKNELKQLSASINDMKTILIYVTISRTLYKNS